MEGVVKGFRTRTYIIWLSPRSNGVFNQVIIITTPHKTNIDSTATTTNKQDSRGRSESYQHTRGSCQHGINELV